MICKLIHVDVSITLAYFWLLLNLFSNSPDTAFTIRNSRIPVPGNMSNGKKTCRTKLKCHCFLTRCSYWLGFSNEPRLIFLWGFCLDHYAFLFQENKIQHAVWSMDLE